ncbi:odorant receptor 4-like [Vanessa atalanta]|uniref:odorant receptor 4-like n=1 Tax=Vanessa atalanta TaxID=42275 RepID=UPI001FCDFB8C|nr:odorant receptor 4-like [Vanessa atalanta]
MNTFLLTLGLMYPNPRTDGKRKILIGCLILSVTPGLMLACNDMRLRILNNDMANLVRQSIIMVSLTFVIIKLIITVFRSNELRALFDGINEDYEKFNYLPEEYQQIVAETIKRSKGLEKIWIVIMSLTACSYPVLAGVCTIYSMMFSDNPRRFMVHEIEVFYLTAEQKYESPYFELIAFYSIFVVWVVFIGFTGFDGMFSVCVFHVSLKIKIFSLNLKYMFVDATDIPTIKIRIAKFVKDHCEVSRLIGEIQKCFEIWLVGIFFNAVLQIGMALSQITTNVGSDINGVYYLFAVATVVHIYLPCYLISDVIYNAAEVANVAYSSSWEMIEDVNIKKYICLIITKAQIPIHFRALGMITFNMEMFVSILQTSYSMYTLLRK